MEKNLSSLVPKLEGIPEAAQWQPPPLLGAHQGQTLQNVPNHPLCYSSHLAIDVAIVFHIL